MEHLYFLNGEYKEDKLYNLYIATFSCSFKLKKGKIPSIQIKNNLSYVPNEFIESTNGDIVTLTLTSIDIKLMFENYEVNDLIWHNGFKFKSVKGLFTNYVEYWTAKKIKAKKEENGALYLIAKLMLNSLYGKFGLNPNVRGKYPTLDENGVLKYKFYDAEIRNSIYVPVASFITAYARYDIITSCEKIRDYSVEKYNKDLYVYSDTDSIHCLLSNKDIEELSKILDIDDYKLGYWKLESTFKRGKYLRQKCYIEEDDEKIHTTIAGLPKKLGHLITFDNFQEGLEVKADGSRKENKLRYKQVKGGVVLVETDFTIK